MSAGVKYVIPETLGADPSNERELLGHLMRHKGESNG